MHAPGHNRPPVILPNVRKFFITDPGYVMYEADLKGADGWVVAWEADDDDLKATFKSGIDVHVKNAEDMWGSAFTSLPSGSHARDFKRQECKHTVHGIHYGCTPRTTAVQRGWLVIEAERFHNRWLTLHPGVRNYHNRVRKCLETSRTITNAFGFRRVFFDRLDACFTDALAWIPQGTVALNTYKGALQLEAKYWPEQLSDTYYPDPQNPEGLLLQTHDSINFQFQTGRIPPSDDIRSTLSVKIPYPDPLYIPWELKSSDRSWGDMQKLK